MAPALQISIPTTSTATPADGKPYTLYHINLQLPLRKHEIKKRYTDFVNLHAELQSQTNLTPPAPLPAKSWLWRTVNNQSLAEDRRQALEKYITSILEADNACWRSSSAWRTFLNLPSGASSNGVGSKPTSSTRSSTISDPNHWLDVHRDLKSQIQAARQLLKQREAANTAQTQHSLSADAKASLVRAASFIAQLDDGLKAINSNNSNRLGQGELTRRKDLLGAAKKEVEGLEAVLRSLATKTTTASSTTTSAAATQADKEALFRGGATKTSGRVLGGPLKETERTRERDNSGVLQLQQQIMQEQDEDVMSLGKTVARLKDMGIMMGEELEIQNAMLGLVEQDSDRLQGKIDVARSRIKRIK